MSRCFGPGFNSPHLHHKYSHQLKLLSGGILAGQIENTFDGGDTAFDRAYGSTIDNLIGHTMTTKVKANENFVEELALAA